jgi:hypothetical protein
MRAIYFCDIPFEGTIQDELDVLKFKLSEAKIPEFKIEVTDRPPFKEQYDILFFDWGGMSIGNSILEHFCRHIYEQALERPGTAFVMVSYFTKEAMDDAIKEFGKDKPDNIFLEIEDAKNWILTIAQTPKKKKRK